MRTKKQYFKVICLLLKLLLIKYLKYVCFNYFCNIVKFVNLINNKTYNKYYALNLLKC